MCSNRRDNQIMQHNALHTTALSVEIIMIDLNESIVT